MKDATEVVSSDRPYAPSADLQRLNGKRLFIIGAVMSMIRLTRRSSEVWRRHAKSTVT
jgi:hypothetical protein